MWCFSLPCGSSSREVEVVALSWEVEALSPISAGITAPFTKGPGTPQLHPKSCPITSSYKSQNSHNKFFAF